MHFVLAISFTKAVRISRVSYISKTAGYTLLQKIL